MENKTNKRRGFCFVTFKEEEPVKKIMEKKFHNIGLSKVNGPYIHGGMSDQSKKQYLLSLNLTCEIGL